MSASDSTGAAGWRVEIRVQGGRQDPLERLLGILRVRRLPFRHLSYDPPDAYCCGLLVLEVDSPLDVIEKVLAFVQRTVGISSTELVPSPKRTVPVSEDQTMALT